MTTLIFDPPVIGHRGACAYAPENTMVSFTKAAQLGVKWVEFDVMQAASGELVVFHDEWLGRTTDGHGKLTQSPYSYLSSLDAGTWFDSVYSGERIPTLLTVIEFLKTVGLSANIEIKAAPGHEKDLVDRIIVEMSPYLLKTNQQFLFSSFSVPILHYLHQCSRHCQTGLLLHEWRSGWEELCRSLQCVAVHVDHAILTEERVHHIKQAMKKTLLAYTVNSPGRAKTLFSWGVDAVFSDVPDKILNIALMPL